MKTKGDMTERQVKILHVDDQEASRYAVGRVLRQEGFLVKEGATGAEALELAMEIPDLIVLDVRLPDINGFEVCRKIKSQPPTSMIPVLLLTSTYQDDASKVQGLDSGADGYLTEPIEPAVLIAYIKALLRARKAEEGLVSAGREWESTFDAIGDSIALFDHDGRIMRCNKAFASIVGKPIPEIIGQTIWKLLYASTEPVEDSPAVKMFWSKKRESLNLSIGDKWYRIAVDPFFDKSGNFLGAIHVMTDITDRKQMEEALRQNEERYRLAIRATNDAVRDLNLIEDTVQWNETYTSIYGRPAGTANSIQLWIDHIHPEDRERVESSFRAALDGADITWTCEYRFMRGDGEWAEIYDRAYIARDESGKAWRVVGAMQDRTERTRAERALRESEARYRNLSETLDAQVKKKVAELQQAETLAAIGRMVASVAHEVRNPLQCIRMGIDSIRDELQSDPVKKEILAEIDGGLITLNQTIQELLDYARPIKPHYRNHSVADLVQQALKVLAEETQKVTVQVNLEDEGHEVAVDSQMFNRVLINLIRNGVEAMPNGGNLTISSRFVRDDGEKFLDLSISDTGHGIEKENLHRIFEPFFTTKREGTGLGVSISRKIIEAHKGKMSVISEVDKGTTVEITIPAEPEVEKKRKMKRVG